MLLQEPRSSRRRRHHRLILNASLSLGNPTSDRGPAMRHGNARTWPLGELSYRHRTARLPALFSHAGGRP
jgi:hypothetical protein